MFETTATFAQHSPALVVFGYAENYKLSAESKQHNRQQATGNRQQAIMMSL